MVDNRIKVLLADDSSVVRRIIEKVVDTDPRSAIVFSAKNGREAVDNLQLAKPDVVVLDVEMPVMDGIEALVAIRRMDKEIPVIMCSSLTSQNSEAALDAIMHGASDYITKPTNAGHIDRAISQFREQLLPKIWVWGESRKSAKVDRPTVNVPKSPERCAPEPVDVIVIGVSTGGPNALMEVIPKLPVDFPIPVVVVQHMPPTFTTMLAARLDSNSCLNVKEVTKSEKLSSGTVWMAPGDQHVVFKRQGTSTLLQLDDGPAVNSCRPSVDVLFDSAATTFGKRCLGVVLTGMGKDGVKGCRSIKKYGGQVVVQDEKTSVVWGMPRAVMDAGLSDAVLPIDSITSEITKRAKNRAQGNVLDKKHNSLLA